MSYKAYKDLLKALQCVFVNGLWKKIRMRVTLERIAQNFVGAHAQFVSVRGGGV